MTPVEVSQIGSNIFKKHEESAKRAINLRQKELKWKLMQSSQIQNLAKLDEIKIEKDFSRQRMIKVSNLAIKLRAKYIKACKAARITELAHKQLEQRFSEHEKHVAEEKMQLTRLGVECRKLGKQLYGQEYKLLTSPNKRRCSDNFMKPTRLSSLYDLRNSQLRNLASYRLTKCFQESNMCLTDLRYTHNIDPSSDICILDLEGKSNNNCQDKNCPAQHESNYKMTPVEQLADILSYRPSLIGFKQDPELSKEENETNCRLQLKQYAVRLLAKNGDKNLELIIANLIKYVQNNKTDLELLVATRKLAKRSNFVRPKTTKNSIRANNKNKNSNNTMDDNNTGLAQTTADVMS